MTRFYQEQRNRLSPPVERAHALAYLLEHKTICINAGELIVGEKGPAPKATPTYPELCCHTLQDLDILDLAGEDPVQGQRGRSRSTRRRLIPSGAARPCASGSVRDDTGMDRRLRGGHLHRVHGAALARPYRAGRQDLSQGHAGFQGGHRRAAGRAGLPERSRRRITSRKSSRPWRSRGGGDPLCASGTPNGRASWPSKSRSAAPQAELERIAEVCAHVPAHAPRDFWEALQDYWFVHLGVTTELNPWDAFNPGRLDQHLYPFYEQGLDRGHADHEQAEELLQCFWIKFNNQPAPPKVGRDGRRRAAPTRISPRSTRAASRRTAPTRSTRSRT